MFSHFLFPGITVHFAVVHWLRERDTQLGQFKFSKESNIFWNNNATQITFKKRKEKDKISTHIILKFIYKICYVALNALFDFFSINYIYDVFIFKIQESESLIIETIIKIVASTLIWKWGMRDRFIKKLELVAHFQELPYYYWQYYTQCTQSNQMQWSLMLILLRTIVTRNPVLWCVDCRVLIKQIIIILLLLFILI